MKINKIKNQIGATAIEYALLAGLIAVVSITGVSATGSGVSNTFCTIASKIGTASSCGSNSSGPVSLSDVLAKVTMSGWYENGHQRYWKITPDKLKFNITSGVDSQFFDKSVGGRAIYSGVNWNTDNDIGTGQAFMASMASSLENINSNDPIQYVLGVYDNTTKQQISDYSTVLQAFKNGAKNPSSSTISKVGVLDPLSPNNPPQITPDIEVITKSGKLIDIAPVPVA